MVEAPPTAAALERRQRLRIAVERLCAQEEKEREKACALQMCDMRASRPQHTDDAFEPEPAIAIVEQQQQPAPDTEGVGPKASDRSRASSPAQQESIGWFEEASSGSDAGSLLDHAREAEQHMKQQMEWYWMSATPPLSTQSPPPPPPPPPPLPQASPSWQPQQSAMTPMPSASFTNTLPAAFPPFEATQGQLGDDGICQVRGNIVVEFADCSYKN